MARKEVTLAFTGTGPQRKGLNRLLEDEDENQSNSIQRITSFDGRETKMQADVGARRINPIPNTFREGRRYMPSYIPEKIEEEEIKATGIDKFEQIDVGISENAREDIKYGLTKREQGSSQGMSQQDRDAVVLKEDLRRLPPESSVEDYEQMPVEAFGEALMRGMGWFEGRGIGRNAKGEVEAKELVRRADKLGLGADPAQTKNNKKRFIKPGESRDQDDFVYVDNAGAIKSSRPVDGNLTKRKDLGVAVGKTMYLHSGKHSGFECEVKSIDEVTEKASVRLLPSMEVVTVRYRDLSQKRQPNDSKQKAQVKKVKLSARPENPWLYTNIRIKVVDKKAFGGRLYLKKGTIVDVKAPKVCDIYIDDFGEVFQDLKQNQIETSVPRQAGATVLVVAGTLKGCKGQLLHRSKQSDYIAVKVHDEDEVQKLHLDDVAEYRGPDIT
jgi:G patch domain and KOW motifs-containing protein